VSVAISDGLGNQMFQYATGLAMARRLGVPLRCHIKVFARSRGRPLGLKEFGLKLDRNWRPLAERLRLLRVDVTVPVIRDHAEFVPEVLTAAAPVRLEGWFQSWRYFDAIQEDLRRAFDFDQIRLGPPAEAMLGRIRAAVMPVAVHVRRGDYRNHPSAFPLLDREHYARARTRLESEIGPPSYFVFSDEPEVAAELTADWPDRTLVSGFRATEDFRLMASCRHFFIANSTFSWWGAWLGRSPDKRVIAPRSGMARVSAAGSMSTRGCHPIGSGSSQDQSAAKIGSCGYQSVPPEIGGT